MPRLSHPLDALGNWAEFKQDAGDGAAWDLDQARLHNAVNEIDTDNDHANGPDSGAIAESAGPAWVSPACDARGNMTTIPQPGDLTDTYTCTFDAWNRLVEVKDGSNVILKCEFDALGRRTKKFINTGEDQTCDEFLHFYYDSSGQILETRRSDSENDPPDAENPECQFVWSARGIGVPILRDENKDADGDCIDGSDERLYYTTDAGMNVTALLDTGGDAVERYVYDPYGHCTVWDDDWSETVDWDDSKKNPIRLHGLVFDNETGLYQNYHAELGRWMQRIATDFRGSMGLHENGKAGPSGAIGIHGPQGESSSPCVMTAETRDALNFVRAHGTVVYKLCDTWRKTNATRPTRDLPNWKNQSPYMWRREYGGAFTRLGKEGAPGIHPVLPGQPGRGRIKITQPRWVTERGIGSIVGSYHAHPDDIREDPHDLSTHRRRFGANGTSDDSPYHPPSPADIQDLSKHPELPGVGMVVDRRYLYLFQEDGCVWVFVHPCIALHTGELSQVLPEGYHQGDELDAQLEDPGREEPEQAIPPGMPGIQRGEDAMVFPEIGPYDHGDIPPSQW